MFKALGIAIGLVHDRNGLKLQCDTQVKISPQHADDSLEERFKGIQLFLTPALLTQLRSYLTLLRLLDYSISDDVQKVS